MKAAHLTLALAATALAGCSMTSASSGLTTGSLFSSEAKATPAPGPVNDAPSRAFQVGTVSARAIKCGFNFDPAKLKTNYLAYERAIGSTTDMARVERTYDVSFNGVAKAVADEKDYCSDTKTAAIKTELARHLAGDYSPSPPPKAEPEEGLFSGWGGGGDDGKSMKSTLPGDNSNI